MRLFYIGFLVLVTVASYEIMEPSDILDVFVLVVGGSIVANVAFLAGPALDTYIRWLGYRRSWPRWTMFILGTLFASGLAVFSIYNLDN